MRPITRQLIVAAFILTLVTVASLGIRQVRFSAYRTNAVESAAIAATEPDSQPAESPTVESEPDLKYAGPSEPDEQKPSGDLSKAKLFKGDYAKAKGSKGALEKVFLGENENLYITAEGETWYVNKQPDGKTTKMQVQIDDTTGEMTVVSKSEYAKSDGSQGLQRISMGDNEDVYITEEGQTWYVTEGSKARVEIDDNSGEMTVLEQYDGDGGK